VDPADPAEGRAALAGPWRQLDQIVELVADEGLGPAVEVGHHGLAGPTESVAGIDELHEGHVLVEVERPGLAGEGQHALRTLVELHDRSPESLGDPGPGGVVELLGVGHHRLDGRGQAVVVLGEGGEHRGWAGQHVQPIGR
jgi:hypothetical protein